MRLERRTLDGDPAALAAEIRALAPPPADVVADVAAILARVRAEGDAAVVELTERFDGEAAAAAPPRFEELAPDVRDGLELARENVAAVARAQLGPPETEVALAKGQRVVVRETAVASAAVYVPGGRAPYPSTVVMGAVTARTAGVERVVICSPPPVDPVILGACALCGVDEVYAMGGAQAIAALAYGTDTVAPVDVIVGPGNAYVTEAKRQLFGRVGIDGLAGPSELVVVITDAAAAPLAALDLAAQAEHGPGSLVVAISPDHAVLGCLEIDLDATGGVPCVLVATRDAAAALALADALAPEHLQLVGEDVEGHVAGRVAGAVFVGRASATAFGDYLVGSNHVLPTGGAARFASALSPRVFRRRVTEVRATPRPRSPRPALRWRGPRASRSTRGRWRPALVRIPGVHEPQRRHRP